MAISTRMSRNPVTPSAQSPSIGARPSISRPSSVKNSMAASRSSTTMPTLSIRLTVMMFPWRLTTFRCGNRDRDRPGMREGAAGQGPGAHFCISPTHCTEGRPGGSWSGAAEHQQVIGDDPEPHPALHPALAVVPAAPEPMTTLERADPSFAPRAPAERRAGNPRALLAGLPRQHDVPDPAVLRRAFIRARGEAAVGDGELRGAIEERHVAIQGGFPEGALRLAALTHRVVGDELRLGLLDLHEPPKLGGLRQLALSENLRVRLEETDHLVRVVRIAAEHAGARLRQHLPEQRDRRGQQGRVVPGSPPG